MADPPPEDPAGQPLAAGIAHQSLQPVGQTIASGNPLQPHHPAGHPTDAGAPPQLLQTAGQPPAAGCSPQPVQSERPDSSPPGVHPGEPHGQPPSSTESARPPLADLNPNGVSLINPALPKKAPPARPSMGTPLRKIKKKKSAIKVQTSHLSHDEALQNELKKVCPKIGLPVVVQPLQVVEGVDVSVAEEDDEWWSDDEEEFDLEDYFMDEEKRAELKCLLEKYDAYDEEQLRLAIMRERKQGISDLQPLAGIRPPSPESAPASPSHTPSRFIPPASHKSLVNHDKILTKIPPTNLAEVTPYHLKTFGSILTQNPMHDTSLPMQPPNPIPMHDATLGPMHDSTLPMQQPSIPIPMQTLAIPMQNPNHSQQPPSPMQTEHNPNPPPSSNAQSGHSQARPNSPSPSNNGPNSCSQLDLTNFPPLPKVSTVHGNGGNGDTTMISVDEGDSRPNDAPSLGISVPPTEQSHTSALAPAPRPPTSLAERVKNSAPPTAPVAFNPTKYTPIGAKGDREGTPVISFTKTDTECLAGRVGLAVVGKFSHSIPSSHNINKALNNIPIKGTLMWNFLNAKHVLIRLSDAEDYAKLLHGVNGMPVWYVESVPMRVFKWTPEFDPSFETPIVAVWCNLPALPIHLYDQRALYMICSSLGNPIQVDHATASRSRITFARVCVEIDITKPPVEEFVIDMAGTEVRQKVVWDKIPRYCSDCKHVGHLPESCYAFGRNARPDKKPAPQSRAPGPRTKSVPRPSPLTHGAAAPSAPPMAPLSSSGATRKASAPGEGPAVARSRSPSHAHDRSGVLGPMPGSSTAPALLKSPYASSSSGMRPLRLGERSLRPPSSSPPRTPRAPGASMALGVPVAPGARVAPRSPSKASMALGAPVVSGARGAPRSPSRGHSSPGAHGDTHMRQASPRASPVRPPHGTSLGEWIDVAQSKVKKPTCEGVADVPTKNAFVVLGDGTEVLEADYESDADRDIVMADDSRDMAVDSVQGSSTPNRGRVLPASLGGNLRSGVSAPASS